MKLIQQRVLCKQTKISTIHCLQLKTFKHYYSSKKIETFNDAQSYFSASRNKYTLKPFSYQK